MKKHESVGAPRIKPVVCETVWNHQIGENGYIGIGEINYLEFPDEPQLQKSLHVHRSGFSLNTAQPWVDKNYSGQKVIGIRSCSPALDKEGNSGSILILKSSI